ncbi:MAG: M48 family metalloprotease [Gemmatales bacterium]|nr:M48 family metalloprotease [Gemmatales bacterium]MDW7995429.1 M48 family metalloprotease [Gemmatales bacterium]
MPATPNVSQKPYYPPSPPVVPDNLTALPRGYIGRALLVLMCLYLFVLVYLGLAAGSAYLVYWSVWKLPWAPEGTRGRAAAGYFFFVKIPAMLASGMLCLFLVKGLFTRSRRDRDMLMELRAEEHPRLFAFLRKLCQEVAAPFPKRVFVTYDVNAAVFYNSSALGLFLPVRKNLLIGLGLVNVVNLSEFKAALAHEFGHFSQRTMKLGSCVYTMNRLIVDMVFERDWWDDLLDQWKGWDLRISWLAYVLAAFTWMVRKILMGIFLLSNLAERGLSRAMEFHADKVAVAAAGSEALVRCLYKLHPGSEALQRALSDLYWASERKLYSRDFYYHHSRALEHLSKEKNDPNYGVPPPLPKDPGQRQPLFKPEERQDTNIWDTHPPDYLREQNACNPYIVAEQDERSPWLLFGRTDEDIRRLREKMTLRVYRHILEIREKQLPLQAPETVQQEIDAEHEALTFDPKYQGLYENRYLFLEHLEDWMQEADANPTSVGQLRERVREIYSRDWRPVMKRWGELLEERQTAQAIAEGRERPEEGRFSALGTTWPVAKAEQVFRKLESEVQTIENQIREADKAIFQAHYLMAKEVSQQARDALVKYYQWARRLEDWCTKLKRHAELMDMIGHLISSDADFARQEGANIVETFLGIRRDLDPIYMEIMQAQVPKLMGLQDQPRASAVILPQGLVPREPDENRGLPLGEWLEKMWQQLSGARTRSHRLYVRTLTTILAIEEEIERRWQRRQSR